MQRTGRRGVLPNPAVEARIIAVANLPVSHHATVHQQGFHHCDIKPRNLLWTQKGAKIIDFNVSVRSDDRETRGGGSRRYLPPDFDPEIIAHNGERADRDVYALGLTLYEALTGRYPWDSSEPPTTAPPDPRELSGFSDLSPEFVNVVMRAISPKRSDRWHTALEMRTALVDVHQARRPLPPSVSAEAVATALAAGRPRTLSCLSGWPAFHQRCNRLASCRVAIKQCHYRCRYGHFYPQSSRPLHNRAGAVHALCHMA